MKTSGALAVRQALEAQVHELVERSVLPALGQAGARVQLTIPRLGLSSLVYLADVDGGEPFVVRVARPGKERRALDRRRRATAFWVARGLPTPELLAADCSRRTARRTGWVWLCERRVHGGHAVDLPPGHPGWAAVGRSFAAIHAVRRRWHHGSLFQPRGGPFAYRLVRRHGEWIRALARWGRVDRDLERAHRVWLGRFDADLRRRRGFELIHRRCTESDVLLDEQDRAWVLEPHRSGFGCFLTDLVRVEERICRDDPDRVASFLDGYFRVAPGRRDEYEALVPVFRADLYLAKALRHARRARGGREESEAELARELERYRKTTGIA